MAATTRWPISPGGATSSFVWSAAAQVTSASSHFQTRRSLRDLTGYQVLIEVANYSDEPVRCRLEIERNGMMVDIIPLSIAAGSTWHQVLDKASNEGGRLRARLDRADALAADNEAWAILPPRDPLAVTMFASDQGFADLYVEKVLEASPLVRQPPAVIRGPATDSTDGTTAIRVYHRRVPARLPPGPALLIGPDSVVRSVGYRRADQSADRRQAGGGVAAPGFREA